MNQENINEQVNIASEIPGEAVPESPPTENVSDIPTTEPAQPDGNAPPPKGKKQKDKTKKKKGRIVRIEELEDIMSDPSRDVDTDAIVSMYMPRRRAKAIGLALLRMDKLRLTLLALVLLVALLFVLSFMQENMGNFTINLNRLELYRKGIAISATGSFDEPTARLVVNTVQDATNITLADLPENLDEIDGDHNGRNYMAYTYYVRNAGKVDVGYVASVVMDSSSKGAEDAIRLAIWKNGVRTVYAEPSKDGTPEEGCVNFLTRELVCSYAEDQFLVGNVDKYTIVMWLEGEDPECVDSIVGGSVEFSMTIDALEEDKDSLLAKFVQDVRDTLSGDKPIGAAGTDAPDYYNAGEVNWENRRNQ